MSDTELPGRPGAEQEVSGAKLAEIDAGAFRSEGPRTDTKVAALLTLLAAMIGATGVLGTVGTTVSRQSGAPVAAVLLGVAAVVIVVGLVMVVLVILPRFHRPGGQGIGALVTVAELPDPVAAREHYLKAGDDPLGYHAAGAWVHARMIVDRYRRIRRAGWVLLGGMVLALVGGLALGWGW